jgi:hypothetical protein
MAACLLSTSLRISRYGNKMQRQLLRTSSIVSSLNAVSNLATTPETSMLNNLLNKNIETPQFLFVGGQ